MRLLQLFTRSEGSATVSLRLVAHSSVVALAFLAVESVGAQSSPRTTLGHLLAGPVDTIEAMARMGGKLGARGASLQLVHVDSAYSGTLQMQVYVPAPMVPVRPGDPQIPARRCDTTLTVTMTSSAARRLFALVRPAVIEPGEPPQLPTATDVFNEYSYRLTSGSNAVLVHKARTLLHGGTRYRAPVKRVGPAQPPWAAFDMNSPLVKADELLRQYLQPERLLAFSNACRVPSLPAHALHPDSLFDRLVGNWVLRGTIARQQTTHDVAFTWMLGREYVQMHEVSRERAANGTPAYEAVVMFGRDPKTGEYGILWMDNTAASAFDPAGIGKGFVADDSIPFLFNYSATDRFHTTFVYDRAADRWQWHMDNDSAGVRKPFARVTLTRR